MKLKEIQQIFHHELDSIYGKDEVDSFFFMLTESYFGLVRLTLALRPDVVISKEEESQMFDALASLKLERPIQQILGKASFMGMDFWVNEHVLIPRPETEELVHWITEDHKEHEDPLTILDIGTGSGCIAVSLAKKLPHAKVLAMDISAEALEVAKQNAVDNKADVTFIIRDILAAENLPQKKYDIIVSNPPYVRQSEKEQMKPNVLEYEPHTALFVEDEDPLVFYDKIADLALVGLKEGGALYFEINQYLGKSLVELLEDKNYKNTELRKDVFNVDRMIKTKKADR